MKFLGLFTGPDIFLKKNRPLINLAKKERSEASLQFNLAKKERSEASLQFNLAKKEICQKKNLFLKIKLSCLGRIL